MLADWPLMTTESPVSGSGSGNVEYIESSLCTDPAAAETFLLFQKIIRGIRNVRAEYKTEPGVKLPCVIRVYTSSIQGKALLHMLQTETASLALLARLDDKNIKFIGLDTPLIANTYDPQTQEQGFGQCVQTIIDESIDVYIPLKDMVDVEKETLRLTKQIEKIQKDIQGLENRLSSPGFKDKAPPKILNEVETLLNDKREQVNAINKSLLELTNK